MKLYARNLQVWVDPADVFVTLFANDEYSFWLDRENHPTHKFSVMSHATDGRVLSAGEVLAELDSVKQNLRTSAEAADLDHPYLPFSWRPGYVGWFEYLTEPLRAKTIDGSWQLVNEAVVIDHEARTIWLSGLFIDDDHFEEWVRAVLLRLGLSGGRSRGYRQSKETKNTPRLSYLAHDSKEYLRLIGEVQNHIALGNIYQGCLTNQIVFEGAGDSLYAFLRLREENPAPYASFVRFGTRALVCSSPEQFLTMNTEGVVVTKPIKGTRPRSNSQELDRQLALELANDRKERAENLMIVDLMRNDLGKVSAADSVTVDRLFEVESYATVHQLVSTISARLLPTATVGQLIGSTFPAGSMTGAPKIRAMQIIANLEQTPRGVYSGAVGYLSSDGSLDLGMVIRSIFFEGDTASIGVGGGITSDSNPQAELDEIRLKAKALLRVIGAEDPWL